MQEESKDTLAAAEKQDRWKTGKCDAVADAYDTEEALAGVDGVEQLVNMVLHEGERDDNRQSSAVV